MSFQMSTCYWASRGLVFRGFSHQVHHRQFKPGDAHLYLCNKLGVGPFKPCFWLSKAKQLPPHAGSPWGAFHLWWVICLWAQESCNRRQPSAVLKPLRKAREGSIHQRSRDTCTRPSLPHSFTFIHSHSPTHLTSEYLVPTWNLSGVNFQICKNFHWLFFIQNNHKAKIIVNILPFYLN